MTPKKNEEIKNKVEELENKGLVREMISPYIVLIMLPLKKDGGLRMCTYLRTNKMIIIRYFKELPYINWNDIVYT